MSFIDRLESEREEAKLRKITSDTIKKLATELTMRSTEQGDGRYADLVQMRIEKAGKAYDHALESFQNDEPEKAFDFAERGLLHLELADYHNSSDGPSKGEVLIDVAGPARENIQRLSDALTEFKLLVEYRNLEVGYLALEKLEHSAQSLQDAIECLAFGDFDKATSTADVGLAWLSFSAAQVVSDPSEFPRSLLLAPAGKKDASSKELVRILELARESGMSLAQSLADGVERGSKVKETLTGYLDNALEAFVETNTRDLSRFLDLLSLESDLLQKAHLKRPKSNAKGTGAKGADAPKDVAVRNYLTDKQSKAAQTSYSAMVDEALAAGLRGSTASGGSVYVNATGDVDAESDDNSDNSSNASASTTDGTSESRSNRNNYGSTSKVDEAPTTTSLKAVFRELKRLSRKYCRDYKPVERVIASLASEVKALDYAIEGEKQQQATYRIANIKAARRELKALLRDADLI
ncbi:MAG: hypothetical protein IPP57_12110 [Candidatus Obscuribacter sp.]|jgi:hypothetical protein|nr:hypothetical protein [Candidatus Obscuribacter sp.]